MRTHTELVDTPRLNSRVVAAAVLYCTAAATAGAREIAVGAQPLACRISSNAQPATAARVAAVTATQ